MAIKLKYKKIKEPISKKKIIIILSIILGIAILAISTVFIIKAVDNKNNNKIDNKDRYYIQGHVLDQKGNGIENVSFIYNGQIIYTTATGGRFFLSNLLEGSEILLECTTEGIILPYTKFQAKENIYITNDNKGFVITVNNTNIKEYVTIKTIDQNNTPISNVSAVANGKTIARSNQLGEILIPISETGLHIKLTLTNYTFKEYDLSYDMKDTTINCCGIFNSDEITTTSVLSYYFKDSNNKVIKNMLINYIEFSDAMYYNKSMTISNGSISIVEKNKFFNFTAYSQIADEEGKYNYISCVYFSNQDATFIAKKGYKITIDIDSTISTDYIYLESNGSDTDKVYSVNNKQIIIYTDNLDFNFYSQFFGYYGDKLTLVNENNEIITSLDMEYNSLKLIRK